MRTLTSLAALTLMTAPATAAPAPEFIGITFGKSAGTGAAEVKCKAKAGCAAFSVFVRNFKKKVVATKHFPSGLKKNGSVKVAFPIPGGSGARVVPLQTFLVTVEPLVRRPGKFKVTEKESAKFAVCRSSSLIWVDPSSDPGRNPDPPPDPDESCRFNGRAYNPR